MSMSFLQSSDLRAPASGTISAAELAYRRIRLEILTFGLRPGATVSEASLARQFAMPIAAIRAALPHLRHDGLLINKNRRGQMVTPVTLDDIEQTYELRQLLEPVAAQYAVRRVDVEQLRELDSRARAPAHGDDRDSEVESIFANRDFHVLIAEASGRHQLARFISALHDQTIRFQYLLRHSERGEHEWQHSHDEILAAFEQRDPERAAEAMRSHIRSGREFTLQAVLRFPEFGQLPLGAVESRARD